MTEEQLRTWLEEISSPPAGYRKGQWALWRIKEHWPELIDQIPASLDRVFVEDLLVPSLVNWVKEALEGRIASEDQERHTKDSPAP
jgi:hypothetical protein